MYRRDSLMTNVQDGLVALLTYLSATANISPIPKMFSWLLSIFGSIYHGFQVAPVMPDPAVTVL